MMKTDQNGGDKGGVSIIAFTHRPKLISDTSGMLPLVWAVGATPVFYRQTWERLRWRWWLGSELLRRFGNWYYGSAWNALIPFWDEMRLAARIQPQLDDTILHFIWAEFASPRRGSHLLKSKGHCIGTFHASARKQELVLGSRFDYAVYDQITLMSRTQMPFLIERGVPEERMHVVLHGVDTALFHPATREVSEADVGPLKALLVGSTERDHAFMAEVLKKLPAGVLELSIRTSGWQQHYYDDTPNMVFLPSMSEQELAEAYQVADLLLMPLIDCTANNALLESMACGTPVMTNRVGGVPEYVDASCNYVMDGKNVDEWVDQISYMAKNREEVLGKRIAVRAWAERFDWKIIAKQYMELYEEVLGS